MPRSKRNKVGELIILFKLCKNSFYWLQTLSIVSLTKTKAKGKDNKTKLIANIREFIDEYKHIFAFTYTNLKATKFRDIRSDFKESK